MAKEEWELDLHFSEHLGPNGLNYEFMHVNSHGQLKNDKKKNS